MRVALASILFAAPDLLLLDEPTNYLDLEGVLWLEDFLKRYRGTVLIVSHDRDLLNTVAEFILHLEHGKLKLYTGGYDTFVATRAAKRALDTAFVKKQEAARQHMQAFVDRFRYKASKARQAQSRIKMLAKTAEGGHSRSTSMSRPSACRSRRKQTRRFCRWIMFRWATSQASRFFPIFPCVSIPTTALRFWGKTAMASRRSRSCSPASSSAESGDMIRSRKLVPGYFAQHQLEELDGAVTPIQTLAKLRPRMTEQEVRTRLGGFGFSADKARTLVGNLSGGERARLMLALTTLDKPNLLILDEPTNHLDIDARGELLAALNDFEGAVILISHDRRLLEATADRLLLVANGHVEPFDGDLDDYRRFLLSGDNTPMQREEPAPKIKKEDARKRSRGTPPAARSR